jgi:hypothetical protein
LYGGVPEFQPALHLPDLPRLRGLDVGREQLQHGIGGVVAFPPRHLHGLLVVRRHVLAEPDVDGVGGGRRRRLAGQGEQQAGDRAHEQERDGEPGDDHHAVPWCP